MNIKRISAIALCFILSALCLSGCGKKAERELYNVKLSKLVELEEYKGIEVDTSDADFIKNYYDAVISSDVANNNFYVKKTEGVIAKGDNANIDYTGKKDGIAFEGGTAQGYDLQIGSGSFIPGFEDGLIGKEIGSTVDLNLTFPEDYGEESLAGAAVVFTVKINHVTTTEQQKPADYYSSLKFATEKAYLDDVTERAVKAYLADTVAEQAKISEYPEEDEAALIDGVIEFYDAQYQAMYQVDFETVLASSSMTLDSFKDDMKKNQLPEMMKRQMALYFVLDNEALEISEEAVKNNQSMPSKALAESYAVEETVLDFLYDNAKIK